MGVPRIQELLSYTKIPKAPNDSLLNDEVRTDKIMSNKIVSNFKHLIIRELIDSRSLLSYERWWFIVS